VLEKFSMDNTKPVSTPLAYHFRIFRYLKDTIDYGIMFSRQQSDLSVMGYVDANYAGNLDD